MLLVRDSILNRMLIYVLHIVCWETFSFFQVITELFICAEKQYLDKIIVILICFLFAGCSLPSISKRWFLKVFVCKVLSVYSILFVSLAVHLDPAVWWLTPPWIPNGAAFFKASSRRISPEPRFLSPRLHVTEHEELKKKVLFIFTMQASFSLITTHRAAVSEALKIAEEVSSKDWEQMEGEKHTKTKRGKGGWSLMTGTQATYR